jgi:hypothetical protein
VRITSKRHIAKTRRILASLPKDLADAEDRLVEHDRRVRLVRQARSETLAILEARPTEAAR